MYHPSNVRESYSRALEHWHQPLFPPFHPQGSFQRTVGQWRQSLQLGHHDGHAVRSVRRPRRGALPLQRRDGLLQRRRVGQQRGRGLLHHTHPEKRPIHCWARQEQCGFSRRSRSFISTAHKNMYCCDAFKSWMLIFGASNAMSTTWHWQPQAEGHSRLWGICSTTW